jgi:hypothetical protein
MDPLAQAMNLLDQAAAVISELVAQNQAKSSERDVEKKAEFLAAKTGVSFEDASAMIKTASEDGSSIDSLIKAAQFIHRNAAFGKVAGIPYTESKTGSMAIDSYLEKEAELLSELGL